GVRWLLIVVLAAVALLAGLYAYTGTEFTACYGMFGSREAAERAADAAREAGLTVDVDHRAGESAVEFTTGETGEDAEEARQAYQEVLEREGGTSGHG